MIKIPQMPSGKHAEQKLKPAEIDIAVKRVCERVGKPVEEIGAKLKIDEYATRFASEGLRIHGATGAQFLNINKLNERFPRVVVDKHENGFIIRLPKRNENTRTMLQHGREYKVSIRSRTAAYVGKKIERGAFIIDHEGKLHFVDVSK